MTKTTLRNYKLDRINAVLSFKEEIELNKEKIQELIQIFNLEFNNQIKIFVINELEKNLNIIQNLINSKNLNDNQVLKLENEKSRIKKYFRK